MAHFIDLKAADGTVFPAYVAQPAGQPRGGMVVVQEIFGVNSHIQAVADQYAAQGYLTVAPATFHRVKAGVNLGYTSDDVSAGAALKAVVEALPVPGVQQDLQAAIHHAGQAGKVGVVGYCWGGLLAWRAAGLADGLAAAVTYYGGGMTKTEEAARKPRVPVMSHFGKLDRVITLDSVKAFTQAQAQVQVHVYDADHGFNCDQRGAYNEAAARLAQERTLAFFASHIG